MLPDSDPREPQARLAWDRRAVFTEDLTSHSLAVSKIGLNGVSQLLEFWRALLQEGVEVEDNDVHVVIPGDEVVVPQLAQQRAEHDAGTDLPLIHGFEEIMNVANDQVPFVEESNRLELAEIASESLAVVDVCLRVVCLNDWINLVSRTGEMRFVVNLAP